MKFAIFTVTKPGDGVWTVGFAAHRTDETGERIGRAILTPTDWEILKVEVTDSPSKIQDVNEPIRTINGLVAYKRRKDIADV